MRKSPIWRGEEVFYLFRQAVILSGLGMGALAAASQQPTTELPRYSALVDSQIRRLQVEVERTRALVEGGTLARKSLKEVEERLADAQDEGVLADTLYGSTPIEKFTEAQGATMIAAAQRRVDRQNAIVEERKLFLENGVISKSELETVSSVLEARRQVLVLAQNRVKLLEDIRRMAEAEKRAEQTATTAPGTLKNSMIRYDGNGAFSLSDVPAISGQFERRFHHPLPVSALGQTMLHQSLGLDHRNRVDIAISPDSGEGVWLRRLLEKLHVPYLAFLSAIPGAATAPHIHIGVGSTRLTSTERR